MQMKPDWLEGTIHTVHYQAALDSVKELLGEMQELPYGQHGYSHGAIVVGSGRVYWHPERSDMGVHISLPPTAMANVGKHPVELLIDLFNLGVEFTRIDLAGDDLKGILNLDTISEFTRSRRYVSRWHDWSYNDNSEGGRTYYYGSPTSESRLCIYDKAAERSAAGQLFVGHWIRVELRLKGKRAQKAAEYIVSHPDDWQPWAAGLIKGYLDFKIPSTDANKSRQESAPWWDEFLGFAVKERITFSVDVRTIEDIQEWLDRQLAPSLCALQTVVGAEKVSAMIASNAHRMKPKHHAMIDLARGYGVPKKPGNESEA
jgi:phage replication initiation protein